MENQPDGHRESALAALRAAQTEDIAVVRAGEAAAERCRVRLLEMVDLGMDYTEGYDAPFTPHTVRKLLRDTGREALILPAGGLGAKARKDRIRSALSA